MTISDGLNRLNATNGWLVAGVGFATVIAANVIGRVGGRLIHGPVRELPDAQQAAVLRQVRDGTVVEATASDGFFTFRST